jgi:hypothetical protein
VEGTAVTLRRDELVLRVNLGPAPAGGLGPWGVVVEESARERGAPVDPAHLLKTGAGGGLAP